jgi:hypothetical protein
MSYENVFREDVNEIQNNIETIQVTIKQSNLKNAGLGIFSLQDIPKGTFITFELNQENICDINVDKNKFSGTYDEYGGNFSGGRPIDYFLNDAGFEYDEPVRVYTPKKLQNINLKGIVSKHKLVCYETLHDVKTGDELYRMYGSSYWSRFVHDTFVTESKNYSRETINLILNSVANGTNIKDFSDNDLYYAFKEVIIKHEVNKAKYIYENLRDKSIISRINNFFAMYDIFGNYSDQFEETMEFLVRLIPDIDNSIRYNYDQIFVDRCKPAIKDKVKIKWLINRYPIYLENKYYKMYINCKKNPSLNSSLCDEYHNMNYGDECEYQNEFHGDLKI